MRKGDDDDEDSEATLGLEQKGKRNIAKFSEKEEHRRGGCVLFQ